jgi:hypothetical protein
LLRAARLLVSHALVFLCDVIMTQVSHDQYIHSTSRSSMPHGKNDVLKPLITLVVASILSLIVLCNCKFVQIYSSEYIPYSEEYYAGLWAGCVNSPKSYDSSNGTTTQGIGYSEHQEDAARKVAMTFGLLACIAGVTAMVGLWPITCKPYDAVWIHIIGGTVIFAFVSQLLTFSIFGTEYCNQYVCRLDYWDGSEYCQTLGCRLGWGGVMSIIAAIWWLIGALGVWMILKKPVEAKTTAGGGVEQPRDVEGGSKK